MGSSLTRVMEKANAYKYLFSTTHEEKRNQGGQEPANRLSQCLSRGTASHSCCERAPESRLDETRHPSGHSQSLLSLSSGSSSAMDCLTPKSRLTDGEACSTSRVDYYTHELEGSNPSTSQPSTRRPGGKARQNARPIKGQQELSTSQLHKCSSEPFKRAVNTHRTNSDLPLPTQVMPKQKEHQTARFHQDTPGKHMEGKKAETSSISQNKSAPTPIETGDHQPPSSLSRSSITGREQTETTSQSSTSETDESTTTAMSNTTSDSETYTPLAMTKY
ncbi:uncharacterized protein [Watersipora subatra]|uniref:uncharacterized protein n=1 Tax=Watersipora subatra TaxID=2589382 RepID=UPI00355BF4D1